LAETGDKQREIAENYDQGAAGNLRYTLRDYDGERLRFYEARKELSKTGKSTKAAELFEEAVCQNFLTMSKTTESAARATSVVLELQDKLRKVDRSKIQADFIQRVDDPIQAEAALRSSIEGSLKRTQPELFVSDDAALVDRRRIILNALYYQEIKECRELPIEQIPNRVKIYGPARVYLGLRMASHMAEVERKQIEADLVRVTGSAAMENPKLDLMITAVGGTPKTYSEREEVAKEKLLDEEAELNPARKYERRLKKLRGSHRAVEDQLAREYGMVFGEAILLNRDKSSIDQSDEPFKITAMPLWKLRLQRAESIKREIEEEWKSQKGIHRLFQRGGFERAMATRVGQLLKEPETAGFNAAFKRRMEFIQENFYAIKTY